MPMIWLTNIILQTIIGLFNEQRYPTAYILSGKIKGQHKLSYSKRIYSAFEGIPYARPPIGDLRFEEAQPADPWQGTLETTNERVCLAQTSGEEDCLYLNVYVPRRNPVPYENLDVLVHIHGGGFAAGGPYTAGPKYLMDRDIVYINFSYRLGLFGFLSTEDEVLPGNLGLKDQVLVLHWIQKNVIFFGGNPKSVTLIGLSSGAMCVHLHYLSPLSKGLFHRGISQSGSSLASYTVQSNPLKTVIKLGVAVGCSNSTTRELINCLKTKPALTILKETKNVYLMIPGIPLLALTAVVEKPSRSAFLTDHPFALIKRNEIYDVPWLVSKTTAEGSDILPILNYSIDVFRNNFEQLLPQILFYRDLVLEEDKPYILEKIKKYYFEFGDIDRDGLINVFGDRAFSIPMAISTCLQSKVNLSPVYDVVYDYINSFRSKLWFNMIPKGIGHTEDATLLYNNSVQYDMVPEKLSRSDEIIKDALLDIILSFTKDGVPKYKNVTWNPLKCNNFVNSLFIGSPNYIVSKKFEFSPSFRFWSFLPIREPFKYSNVFNETEIKLLN